MLGQKKEAIPMEKIYHSVEENRISYFEDASEKIRSCRLSDRDLKVIEIALIRYADRFAMAH